MRKKNAGTLKSGGSAMPVKSRAQAIAIGLSEAREEGARVPKAANKHKAAATKVAVNQAPAKKSGAKKPAGKRPAVKNAAKK